jgi:hypothetical protein
VRDLGLAFIGRGSARPTWRAMGARPGKPGRNKAAAPRLHSGQARRRTSHPCRAGVNSRHKPMRLSLSTACADAIAQSPPYGVDVRTCRPGLQVTNHESRITTHGSLPTACAGSSAQSPPCGVDIRALRPGSWVTDRGSRITTHGSLPTACAGSSAQSPPCGVDIRALRPGSWVTDRGSPGANHDSRITIHQEANKRLIATDANSKIATTHSQQRTSLFLTATKNTIPRPASSTRHGSRVTDRGAETIAGPNSKASR